jgi:hypothetical protein
MTSLCQASCLTFCRWLIGMDRAGQLWSWSHLETRLIKTTKETKWNQKKLNEKGPLIKESLRFTATFASKKIQLLFLPRTQGSMYILFELHCDIMKFLYLLKKLMNKGWNVGNRFNKSRNNECSLWTIIRCFFLCLLKTFELKLADIFL